MTVDDPGRPADERRYALPEAHAIALLDEAHPAYVGALADIPPIIARTLDQVTAAFHTGAGVPFAAYALHDMQAGFTRPMFANSLTTEWLPAWPTCTPASKPASRCGSPTSGAAKAEPRSTLPKRTPR